jgi:dihydrofolate synthase/folylpolyglutamate synthase
MGEKMTYKDTVEFLYNQLPVYHRIGKSAYKADLDNAMALDEYFGHPHKKYKTVHVAGTNGKGSVSHMLASVLQEAGYRTGLYTSPHLKDFRERIKVNGKMIPEDEVISFVEKHMGIIDVIKPSFFEMTVALAFDYFDRAGVDVAVIEVGLGGRLDSTNIITPVLSVITNIGHDHMDMLGNTLEKVSEEKAGIIKNNVPVVIGETQAETKDVFLSKALSTRSEISFADQRFACKPGLYNDIRGVRNYSIADSTSGKIYNGEITLGGDYQSKNLQTIFNALEILSGIFNLSDEKIIAGIRKTVINTGLKGRWQVLGVSPLIICDSGHNKEGLEYNMKQLGNMHKSQLHFVIGFVSDKDLSLVLPLFPADAEYYFTRAAIPRALDEKILQEEALKYNLKGKSFPKIATALASAKKNASPTDIIYVGGSTFVVAEVI